ncbi:hypothetical protein DV532_27200 (plasmid) [Pseudomonas sp. Leaf58]|uniref:hypothetical protein n=1 Tax=unclassified Pseudomonas TaxID=196821 RepID=UPI000700696A|nr:hypothetical protein [Pseudomonas sp. Leaf58]AYG47970.1 hypothetical protein DV532_27200 [Pseudomonas sp. Leaf58]KQN62468.1 hypothetical protein ASF02_09980 [Pseudomonas sp. Leaf58]
MNQKTTASGFTVFWRERRTRILLVILILGFLVGQWAQDAVQRHQQHERYAKIEELRSKSEYHDRILKAYLFCVRDDGEPESTCIANTVQLADLNGYRSRIKEVFDDAHIPSR